MYMTLNVIVKNPKQINKQKPNKTTEFQKNQNSVFLWIMSVEVKPGYSGEFYNFGVRK